MKRLALTALVAVLCLLATAHYSTTAPEHGSITWNEMALGGAQFAEQVVGSVTVHYAPPTAAVQVAKIAAVATLAVNSQVKWGRLDQVRPLHIWIVPEGYGWPQSLPFPRGTRAIQPNLIVAAEEEVRVVFSGPPTGDPPPWEEQSAPFQTLWQESAIAVTQPPESPAFQNTWLHDGLGAILAAPPDTAPSKSWHVKGTHTILRATDLWRTITHLNDVPAPVNIRLATGALLAMVADRWGVNWLTQYPQTADRLTPIAMLQWATGTTDEATAVKAWQARMDATNDADGVNTPTAADMSPVRVEPNLSALPKGPGPMANYSPHRYDLVVRYDPEKHQVAGSETLTWHNGEGVPIDTLYFSLWPNSEQYALYGGSIQIAHVTVDGTAVNFKAQALDLVVPVGRPLPPGGQVKVVITFTTHLPNRITERVFGQTDDRFNLAHWFPILAVLDDRGWNLQPLPTTIGEPYSETADYHVLLNVPVGTVVGATGHQQSMVEEGARWIYEYDAPNVRDWVATGGQKLVITNVKVGHTTIHAIEQDLTWTKAQAEVAAQTLVLFNEKFGPYPYDDLVVTCCSGLEYPQLFYTTSLAPGRLDYRVTTYHELGHQWFYGVVGNDQYGEPWLDEGFARYAERLGMRTLGPKNGLGDMKARPLPPPVNVSSSTREYVRYGASYTVGVYNLGAATLEDLEALLGSERFTQVMKSYVKQFQFKTATTADFMRVAEEVSGQSLTAFFHDHQVNPADRVPYHPPLPLGVEKIQP